MIKWKKTCSSRAKAGQLGGLAKAKNNKQNVANLANAKNAKTNVANVADSDCDCEYDNDNELKENNIKEKASAFKTPTIEEIKAYCQERKNLVDPERFYDFYSSKGWMVGKNKMKDWKAAIRTWEKEAGFKDDIPDENGKIGGFTVL